MVFSDVRFVQNRHFFFYSAGNVISCTKGHLRLIKSTLAPAAWRSFMKISSEEFGDGEYGTERICSAFYLERHHYMHYYTKRQFEISVVKNLTFLFYSNNLFRRLQASFSFSLLFMVERNFDPHLLKTLFWCRVQWGDCVLI